MLFLAATFVACMVAVAFVAIYALRRGGRDERHAIVALLIAVVATQIVSLLEPADRFHGGEMAVDVALAVALLALMLRSAKFWPVWATAAQIAGTLTHLAATQSALSMELYATTQGAWIFPILVALTVGVLRHTNEAERQ